MNAIPARRRSYWHHASLAAASWVLAICGGSPPGPLAAAAPPAGWRADSLRPTDAWNTLVVDMKVKRSRVAGSGAQMSVPAPEASYRIERSSRSGAWKTVITVLGVARFPVYAFSGALMPPGAFPVSRIEDDEDGTPVRAYDAGGRLLRPLAPPAEIAAETALTPPRSSGREWIDTFVVKTAKRAQRLQTFERQFGRASRAGALNRYTRRDADSTVELLVEPKTAVPVQSNVTRAGSLVVHRTFTYGAPRDQVFVRTALHSETLVSPESGERAVVDAAFSNICLEQRRPS